MNTIPSSPCSSRRKETPIKSHRNLRQVSDCASALALSKFLRRTLAAAWLLQAVTLYAQQPGSSLAATPDKSPTPVIGPHSRTWNLTGTPTVELATGMNYWDGKSWSPSDPTFTETPNAFIANRVQHKIRLSADLNVPGAVHVTTPDGLSLSSTPVGIGIYDPVSGQFALIGSVTNCPGALIANNQVLYDNAFLGACASVFYTIEPGTFEQDVVFTGRLDPTVYGFKVDDKSRLQIQILTEFYQPPDPDVITQPLYVETNPAVRQQMVTPDVLDETIGFGEFVLGIGRAFVTPSIAATNGVGAAVAKELIKTEDGRIMLVESVDYLPLRDALLSLPDCPPAGGTAKLHLKKDRQKAYASLAVPPRASVPPQSRHSPLVTRHSVRIPEGVVIDYVANISGSLNSTTLFASDTNYFISGSVFCNGAVTMEPTIFKYRTNTFLQLNNTLTTKSTLYRPIICTAEDDNTVGDSLVGFTNYTGVIDPGGYANPAIYMNQTSLSLTNFRFCYAQQAIRYTSPSANTAASLNVSHSQFVNCIRGIEIDFSGAGTGTGVIAVKVNNSLMANVQYPIYVNAVNNPVQCALANCTLDRATKFVGGSGNSSVAANSTNSIYANITSSSSGVTLAGNYNGFYSGAQQFGANQTTLSSSPFQPVGAGYYYLADSSSLRNAGTTNIYSSLLSDLKKRTTYPPVLVVNTLITNSQTYSPQAQRDTDIPDLGYHYDPLDYELGWVLFTNAVLTVTNGTAIGAFGTNSGTYGLAIGQAATLQSQGTPNNPNWIVQYNTVQEEPITNWVRTSSGALCSEFQGLTPASVINCRFTFFSMPSLDAPAFNASTNIGPLNFQDCEFHGGKLISVRPTVNLTNCLLERVYTDLEPKDTFTNYVRNCLVYGATFTFFPTNSLVQDNLFDSPIITNRNSYSGGFNAYITNLTRLQSTKTNDIILSASPSYQAGPLGAYYILTNSVLINADTTTSASNVCLFHYTVCTNLVGGYQVKETNSWVDVTYHYVATDGAGNPIDTDGDGIPDYLEDTNGDGIPNTGDFSNWQSYNSPNGLGSPPFIIYTPIK
jgi:hypothetical protein